MPRARTRGKIHLGYVYANDPTFVTARLMSQAALVFAPFLRDYLERDISYLSRSEPFFYAVHAQSLLTADELERHLEKVKKAA